MNIADGVESRQENCGKHGPYTSRRIGFGGGYLRGWSGCPKCHHEESQEKMRIQKLQLVQERQREVNEKLAKAGISNKFIGCTFDNLEPQCEQHNNIIKRCRQYAENFKYAREMGSGIVLYGKPGTGKNHIASAIASRVLSSGYTVGLIKAEYMCTAILTAKKYSWKTGKTLEQAVSDYVHADLLIIDEIVEDVADRDAQRAIFNVIDDRYSENKCTILCTNCNVGDDDKSLRSIIGDPAYQRIGETGKRFAFTWDSYRPKKKNHKLWLD